MKEVIIHESSSSTSSVHVQLLPGSKRLQLVVGKVEHPEVAVSSQQGDTLVRQAVIGHIEFLQAAGAVLW